MIWYDMIWYDMIWYGMIWYDMLWYDMIWYDMIWHDRTWYYMIWYDMIWYDMIVHTLLLMVKTSNAFHFIVMFLWKAYGMTPLIWAAQSGHIDVVRVLLKFGADIEVKNNVSKGMFSCVCECVCFILVPWFIIREQNHCTMSLYYIIFYHDM